MVLWYAYVTSSVRHQSFGAFALMFTIHWDTNPIQSVGHSVLCKKRFGGLCPNVQDTLGHEPQSIRHLLSSGKKIIGAYALMFRIYWGTNP